MKNEERFKFSDVPRWYRTTYLVRNKNVPVLRQSRRNKTYSYDCIPKVAFCISNMWRQNRGAEVPIQVQRIPVLQRRSLPARIQLMIGMKLSCFVNICAFRRFIRILITVRSCGINESGENPNIQEVRWIFQ